MDNKPAPRGNTGAQHTNTNGGAMRLFVWDNIKAWFVLTLIFWGFIAVLSWGYTAWSGNSMGMGGICALTPAAQNRK